MRRSAIPVVAGLLAAGASGADPAFAHGPCSCLDRRDVPAGGQVRLVGPDGRQAGGTGYPAYRVIFNPRPADLGIAPDDLAGAYRADAPSETVLSRPRTEPTRRGRFRTPRDAPPGLYMVLIFDGGEGGAHNTWDYLHVVDPGGARPGGVVSEDRAAPPRAPRAPSQRPPGIEVAADGSSSPGWPLVVIAGLGGLALGAVIGRRIRRPGT